MLARKVTVLFSKIAFASMVYPPHIIRNANTAEINPNSNPSTINGKRIKLSVAPTYFIMLISLRRVKTAARMVFAMMTNDTSTNAIMIAPPNKLTMFLTFTMASAKSL